MHQTVVTRPPKQGLLQEKTQHASTKTANSGVASVFYGARYLDPKTSRWISADPAMGEYIPQAPINDEAKKSNKTLPGMGGVFNYVNFHVYHYAGNNPVKLVDPDGRAAGDEFDTMDDAAKDFAKTYNDDSIRKNKEYGSSIYMTDNGKYAYTVPKKGRTSWQIEPSVHPTKKTLATIHTHAREEAGAGNKDKISEDDILGANEDKIPIYVVLPSGTLEFYDPNEPDEWVQWRVVRTGFPDMKTAKDGKDDPVMGFFENISNHQEHNKNFPDQQTSWWDYW